MAVNKCSVSYMEGYLKHAAEFEKYVYLWSQASRKVDSHLNEIDSEYKRLGSAKFHAEARYQSAGRMKGNEVREKEIQTKRYQKIAKLSSTVAKTGIIVMLAIGIIAGLIVSNSPTLIIPKLLAVPLVVLVTVFSMSVFTGFLPVCLIVYFNFKSKAKDSERELRQMRAGNTEERQKTIWQGQIESADASLEHLRLREENMLRRRDEVQNALNEARRNLNSIYAENVLPPMYRNLNAVVAMYGYLETRRCNTIEGHGGIYDTYEVEKLQIEQLYRLMSIDNHLMDMNDKLDQINENQRHMVKELGKVNQTLTNIEGSLDRIEKTNEQIAHNTAISAEADRQTAAAAEWVAWRTRVNGY